MPPILLGTLLLAGLSILTCALGRRLLKWMGVRLAGLEHAAVASAVGWGALQAVPFTLFAVGLGRPIAFQIVLVLLAALLIFEVTAVLRAFARWIIAVFRLSGWTRVWLLIFSAVLACVFLRALCPISDSDGLSYHLTAASRFLQSGRFVFLPTFTYTNWPSSVELFFATVMAVHRDSPAAIVQYHLGMIGMTGAYLLGRGLGGRSAGMLAATVLLAYTVFWEEMTQAHVDLGTTAFATMAVLMLQKSSLRGGDSDRLIRLAAVIAGFAACTKLNGFWVILSLALVLLFNKLRYRDSGEAEKSIQPEGLPDTLRLVLRFSTIAGLIVMPWLIKSWILTGNPVYPMAFGIFGGREWSAEGWPRIQRYFMLMTVPWGMNPTQANAQLGRGAIVAVFCLIAAIVWRQTRGSAARIPARFAAVFALGISFSSGYNLRFLQPAFPSAAASLANWLDKRQRGSAMLICVLTLLLGGRVVGQVLRPDPIAIFRVACGLEGRDEWLRSQLPDYPMVLFANSSIPSNGRILVGTWEESTAYYGVPAFRANYWLQDTFHYDSQVRLLGDLSRIGITHLVLEPMSSRWCGKSAICHGRDENETKALSQLARERGVKLAEINGFTLYRLKL